VIRSLGDHSFVFYGLVFLRVLFQPVFCWPVILVVALCPQPGKQFPTPTPHRDMRSAEGIRADIRLSCSRRSCSPWATARCFTHPEPWLTRTLMPSPTLTVVVPGLELRAMLTFQDGSYSTPGHRLFHHLLVLRLVHKGTTACAKPTPWTSSLRSPEAVVQAWCSVAAGDCGGHCT